MTAAGVQGADSAAGDEWRHQRRGGDALWRTSTAVGRRCGRGARTERAGLGDAYEVIGVVSDARSGSLSPRRGRLRLLNRVAAPASTGEMTLRVSRPGARAKSRSGRALAADGDPTRVRAIADEAARREGGRSDKRARSQALARWASPLAAVGLFPVVELAVHQRRARVAVSVAIRRDASATCAPRVLRREVRLGSGARRRAVMALGGRTLRRDGDSLAPLRATGSPFAFILGVALVRRFAGAAAMRSSHEVRGE